MLEKYAFFHKMFTFVVFFLQKYNKSKHFVMKSELGKTINNYL